MNTFKKPSFLRDIKKIIDPALKEQVEQAILSVENAQAKKDIPELKKLKGYKNGVYYRIKVGDYRICVNIESNIAEFIAFGRRNNIYKRYP